jgi:hypothetical protein
MNSNAQTDIIYPAEGGSIINNCRIDQIKSGNVVYYSIDSTQYHVVALAISQDGVYITLNSVVSATEPSNSSLQTGLYKGHNYDYYKNIRRGALAKRNIGIIFTFVGIGACAAGVAMLIEDKEDPAGTGLYFGGAILSDVGIILWIAGGIKSANNRKAMERSLRATNLSFGPTYNGVGLKLAFN